MAESGTTAKDYLQEQGKARRDLLAKPLPLATFKSLHELESRKRIRIRVSMPVAGAAWRGETVTGKFSGLIFVIFFAAIPYTFWNYEWQIGIISMAAFYCYHRLQVAMSCRWFHDHFMEYPALFHAFYCNGNLGLQIPVTGEVVMSPRDWMTVVEKLKEEMKDNSRE